ncbi:MAG: GNAT family N-acetyltransferase, partial [Enterococcus faecalis]|nr:GNAT family N-acetyltransferase [Enterococcus faecalis]
FLFTDSGCTYQFYERRGFERKKEKDIVMKILNKEVDLRCMLYSKIIQ